MEGVGRGRGSEGSGRKAGGEGGGEEIEGIHIYRIVTMSLCLCSYLKKSRKTEHVVYPYTCTAYTLPQFHIGINFV